VIGESSKNTKGSQCFKCQDYGHIAAQCPSRSLLVSGTDSDDDRLDTVIHELVGSVYDTNKDVRDSSTQLGAIRCLHTIVKMRIGVDLVCSTPILRMEGGNYKMMDGVMRTSLPKQLLRK